MGVGPTASTCLSMLTVTCFHTDRQTHRRVFRQTESQTDTNKTFTYKRLGQKGHPITVKQKMLNKEI